ncbi:PREDICTED: pre-mRNA-splicing factor SLU7-like [Priapulus caudatus]|uniref:Pre-mRNA-splicing factor SLU7 n=1 Tax=Priapulus caudatus TaxID=37621 RepID=A0ABM1E0W7_PRICU|nr:PREDICTED: pre-mRNA-splicing factor SLU7-like [Priapulus caudatus]XP_014665839.1 PREDICTED: pre-mRNA-splicing factor SLU7-like [Priapulus caudatus]XP_014665840.1 PREDICTED: pre-mRNA-splicing factor SLU7-like [Priapulus caudatus]
MSNVHASQPLSVILKSNDAKEPENMRREDWRKAKELEEARKAGTAPAEVDEEGKDINPHIPQYITQVPWYFGTAQPTLKHQRPQPEKQREFSRISEWYKKGVQGSTATKFRKGACENCGSMTHKRKDCLERPRKVGARFTGDDIAPDEHIQPNLGFDYDGKRDRWNGYNPEEFKRVVDEFNKIEEAKRQLKSQKLEEDLMRGETVDASKAKELLEEDDDEERYADDVDMPGTKLDSKERITVRNLRIREDVAKYLRNLDPNSSYYDPKTRSMRENPYQQLGGEEGTQLQYVGDNFVRYTGDTSKMARTQMFAWEAYDKGVDVHLLAEPTKLELLQKEYVVKKDELEEGKKGSILEKYGGEEHLDATPKQLLLAQTENYTEYSRSGKVIRGQERGVAKSKYEEDIFSNNHSSVWGSWWHDGMWGYRCCRGMLKMCYCTGERGIEATAQAGHTGTLAVRDTGEDDEEGEADGRNKVEEEEETSAGPAKSLLEMHKEKVEKKKTKKKKEPSKKDDSSDSDSDSSDSSSSSSSDDSSSSSDSSNSSDSSSSDSDSSSSSSSSDDEDGDKEGEIDQKKLKKALKQEELNNQKALRMLAQDERKRPYNSMKGVKAPTEEEIEAFRMKRPRSDDPMSRFLS